MTNGIRYLILTVDYEIFGSGAGDVRQHVIEPTERMARIAGRFQTPLTIFFEAEEYLAFVRHVRPLWDALRYDPAQLMAEQVQSLIRRGHDVQLHLHPEWFGARLEGGRWILDHDQAAVDHLFADQPAVNGYIASRKSALEDLIGVAEPGRRVQAYRAGAFTAQPGRKLLSALAENGVIIESSVVRGLHRDHGPRGLDYRNCPAGKTLWSIQTEVCQEDAAGKMFEVPVASVQGRRFQQAGLSRLRAKFSRNVPKDRQAQMVRELGLGRNPVSLMKFLWQKVPIKFDFHNVSARTLLKWVQPGRGQPPADPLDVMVLIGHTKEHIDDKNLERFLAGVSADPRLKVITFHELARLLRERRGEPSPARAGEPA